MMIYATRFFSLKIVLLSSNWYSSPRIFRMTKSRRVRLEGRVAHMRETNNAYRILMGKPDENRQKGPLGKPSRRWVDSIKIDYREKGWGTVDLINLTQDRDQWRDILNTIKNI
jgi:hypothetical protein